MLVGLGQLIYKCIFCMQNAVYILIGDELKVSETKSSLQ